MSLVKSSCLSLNYHVTHIKHTARYMSIPRRVVKITSLSVPGEDLQIQLVKAPCRRTSDPADPELTVENCTSGSELGQH